ncbi:maleylpyruvate isomerase family mycothiol-dependent enzyme [Bailinhaonella thermotolerans]|uniref:maleylpyruvate isomerase family mycothiol-dependent enzyme n=1 Tax=Bailinhaonella thermotolerans TaxID=1070861 RepID=UPI00192A37F3|nr:maleylpyruvate isomerase family mycothiol-dependent enzyme [Bailinhaonella thermotolerans]
MEWTHRAHTEALAREIEAFARAVRGMDLDVPVPTCPGWDLRELVRHTGWVHRWAALVVRTRTPELIDRTTVDPKFPAEDREAADWLGAGAVPLISALRDAGPAEAVWSWGGDRHVRFWSRRQLHETAVHRADAELALGREPVIDAEVADDGVAEFFDVLPYARWNRKVRELRAGDGRGETLSWQYGDRPGWVVTLTPEGFGHERSGKPGDVTVRAANATDLLLAVWGRRPIDGPRYTVEGDASLLTWWTGRARV